MQDLRSKGITLIVPMLLWRKRAKSDLHTNTDTKDHVPNLDYTYRVL